ncbi:MAG: hypothetical protein O2962_06340 [Cyanobacteria bacterium]|nr:hypothetical protein [Cyanobacteriota bacterium]
MPSSLSPADSGTTSKAEPGLAKGVQFDYAALLKQHELESADIPTWAVRLSRQTVGKRDALEWIALLEKELGENPQAADVPRAIAKIFAQEEFADEDPALAATSAPATDQPPSEFGAESAEGFDLAASQVVSPVSHRGASPIFAIGGDESKNPFVELPSDDYKLITGEEIGFEIVNRVNDATDNALLTRRTNPTAEFAGAANRVLASELNRPGSTRKSMDLRLASSL